MQVVMFGSQSSLPTLKGTRRVNKVRCFYE